MFITILEYFIRMYGNKIRKNKNRLKNYICFYFFIFLLIIYPFENNMYVLGYYIFSRKIPTQ